MPRIFDGTTVVSFTLLIFFRTQVLQQQIFHSLKFIESRQRNERLTSSLSISLYLFSLEDFYLLLFYAILQQSELKRQIEFYIFPDYYQAVPIVMAFIHRSDFFQFFFFFLSRGIYKKAGHYVTYPHRDVHLKFNQCSWLPLSEFSVLWRYTRKSFRRVSMTHGRDFFFLEIFFYDFHVTDEWLSWSQNFCSWIKSA